MNTINYKFISREVKESTTMLNMKTERYTIKTVTRLYENVKIVAEYYFNKDNVRDRKDMEEAWIEYTPKNKHCFNLIIDTPNKDKFSYPIKDSDYTYLGDLYFDGNNCYFKGDVDLLE